LVLHDEELAVLLRVCRDHDVFYCLTCQKAYKLFELGPDIVTGQRFLDGPLVSAEVFAGRADLITNATLTL
jgi:hypothetical protein